MSAHSYIKVKIVLLNHVIVLFLFYIIYSYHFVTDKQKHFGNSDIRNFIDVFHHTTSTHCTNGSIFKPKSKQLRFITSIHHLFIISLSIQLFYHLLHR